MQSARELVSRPFETIPFIIDENILHERGLMFIGGPPKAYKSFMLNTLCLHLTTGTHLFGAFRRKNRRDIPAFGVRRPYRVLLLEQEIGDYSLKGRILAIANGLPQEQRDLFLDNLFTHSCDRTLRLDQQAGTTAIAQLVERTKAEIVLFDPLVEFHHGDENSTKDMSQVMRFVDLLRDNYGTAVIISHHCGKPNDLRAGADALRGSSVIFGKGDAYLMLSVHNRGAGIIAVEPTLRRGIPIRRFLAKLDWQTQQVRFHDWASTKAMTEAAKITTEIDSDYSEQ